MSFYVPWSLAYLNMAWSYIKLWLGPIVIVAIICFATVFGVMLISSIIRRFMHI